MIKKIVSLLMPSNAKLAEKTADEIQRVVNGQGQSRRDTIAKYSTVARDLSAIANQIASIAADGEISDAEKMVLADGLEPLYAKARKLIGV